MVFATITDPMELHDPVCIWKNTWAAMNEQPMRRETDSISCLKNLQCWNSFLPSKVWVCFFFLFKMYQVFTPPVQEEIFWCLNKETSKLCDLISMKHDYVCYGCLWLVLYLSRRRNLELNGKNPVCRDGELVLLQCLPSSFYFSFFSVFSMAFIHSCLQNMLLFT